VRLVLAGALGTTHEMWSPQVPAFSERFRVVTHDYPEPDGPISLDELGAGVLAELDQVELERVAFCGLSLGGLVGMWLAACAPERIERLVLACTSARFGPPERWTTRAATVRAEGMDAIADAQLDRWFTPAFADEGRGRYRRMFVSMPAEAYARYCDLLAVADLRSELGAIRAPTIVIAGEQDQAVAPEDPVLLAERIPDATLVTVPGAHLANVEYPSAFTRAVLGHLEPEEER
jgi:3-oxoadipate enol-lactonase